MPSQLSVVIPFWNDSDELLRRLPTLESCGRIREVVIACAPNSSFDYPETDLVRIIECQKLGRGNQIAEGIAETSGDWILVLHADSDLAPHQIEILCSLLTSANDEFVGGGFYRRYDDRNPYLNWFEGFERRLSMSRPGIIWGDQAQFFRRSLLEQIGGFPTQPLMEDVEMSRCLKRAGRWALLDPPLASSPRRHKSRGTWRTTMKNMTIIAIYCMGLVSPERLHRWYYRDHRPA